MTDNQKKHFALSLRRVLYLQQILRFSIEDIKDNEYTPNYMQHELNSITNAMNRIISSGKRATTPENWKLVNGDLTKDQLHDISLLLDEVADVENVGDIVNILKNAKMPA